MSTEVDYKKEFMKLCQEIELEANKELSNEEWIGVYMYNEIDGCYCDSSDPLADAPILYARKLLKWRG